MGKYPTRPHFAHSNMCPNMTNSGQIRYFGTSLGQPHMVKRGIPEKILPMQFRSIDFVWIVKSYDQISILPDFSIVIGHHHFSPSIFRNTWSKHQTKLRFCLQKVIFFIVWLQANQIFWTLEYGPIWMCCEIFEAKTGRKGGFGLFFW